MITAEMVVQCEQHTNGHALLSQQGVATLAIFYIKGELRARDVAIELGVDSYAGPARVAALVKAGYLERKSRGVYALNMEGAREAERLFGSTEEEIAA